eukprot:SAG11_NODE_15754_length_567_cov_1.076923_1_plen_58_part_00
MTDVIAVLMHRPNLGPCGFRLCIIMLGLWRVSKIRAELERDRVESSLMALWRVSVSV